MIDNIVFKLMQAFPNSFMNQYGEFIAHEKGNEYFKLSECKNELEIKCKVLEWFSRAAFKSEIYSQAKRNAEFHKFMLDGINKFLETEFTSEDMQLIYTHLGNSVHRNLCIKFINSDYDMDVLKAVG